MKDSDCIPDAALNADAATAQSAAAQVRERVAKAVGSFVVHDDHGGPDTEVLADMIGGPNYGTDRVYELADAILCTIGHGELLDALLVILNGVEDENCSSEDGVDGVVLLPLYESEIRKARAAITKAKGSTPSSAEQTADATCGMPPNPTKEPTP